jgi:transposase-like protein
MKTQRIMESDELNLVTLAQEFSDENRARALLEAMRWPDGPVCPHCRNHTEKPIYRLKPRKTGVRAGQSGRLKCGACSKHFSVRVGTVLEASHIPISKWLQAFFILCAAKKGVSAHQMHRMIKVTYKTAWFLCHRIRFAMGDSAQEQSAAMVGEVECDELYVGPKSDRKHQMSSKVALAALVQRDGVVRTKVMGSVTEKNMRQFIGKNVSKTATLNTDEHASYRGKFKDYKAHYTVNHSKDEYARKNPDGSVAHVNNCESFFSLLRRGIIGSFHHVSTQHLHRYADEFSFRWSNRSVNDGERMEVAIEKAEGKRLTFHELT